MNHEIMLLILKQVLFIFGFLGIYQLKHWLADYPFQNEYMLQKFRPDWGFFTPLLAHCGMHAFFTLVIVGAAVYQIQGGLLFAVGLALFDMVVHFFMDRLKAGPKYLGRFKPLTAETYPTSTDKQKVENKYFWWSLGVDQGVHHITHYVIIFLLWAKVWGFWEFIWGQ